MGTRAKKGSKFERDICRQLSLWWTGGMRDDVFWRSAGSGARAKTRGRGGKETFGQHGDIAATDPIGAPLIDLFTIELKRGYASATIHDLLDKAPGAAIQPIEKWILQAQESHEQAGSFSWLLITKRDRREPMIMMPYNMYNRLSLSGLDRLSFISDHYFIHIVPLDQFLKQVKPGKLRALSKRL